MLEFKDYYKVLGVERDATADQIKKAYRKLARQYHPDVSSQPDAAHRMSQINEAYAALSDVERRAAYDALGKGRQQGERFSPSPDWEDGFEFSGAGVAGTEADQFSDFFSQLFGRSAGGPRGPQPRGGGGSGAGFAMRGEDHHARIVLDLQDALSGATRQVTLR
jgi:curved DNA-binding protein